MSNSPHLDARLEMPFERGRYVQFDDLTRLCDRLKECLRSTESAVTGDTPNAKYRLRELELGSIEISLAPLYSEESAGIAADTIQLFNTTVAALQSGTQVDDRLGRPTLLVYKKLAETFFRRNSRISVGGVEITSRFVANIDELLGRYFVSEGSVKGRIERLNIHNKRECALFSPIHDRGIECSFETETFPVVHAAVGKNATVFGKLKFSGRSALPDHILITGIDVHPEDDDLPTLESLRGLITSSNLDNLGPSGFLASIRNGNP